MDLVPPALTCSDPMMIHSVIDRQTNLGRLNQTGARVGKKVEIGQSGLKRPARPEQFPYWPCQFVTRQGRLRPADSSPSTRNPVYGESGINRTSRPMLSLADLASLLTSGETSTLPVGCQDPARPTETIDKILDHTG